MKIIKNAEDLEFLAEVEKAIADNDGYCCCKLQHLPENKCICQEFLNSKVLGRCDCGRYIKTEL